MVQNGKSSGNKNIAKNQNPQMLNILTWLLSLKDFLILFAISVVLLTTYLPLLIDYDDHW
jgi:hypothetical protein